MPEMWDAPPAQDAFALPGDDEIYGDPADRAAEEVPAEQPAEETQAERPRNPDGTFAPQAAEEEEAEEETPAETQERLLAGKFKDADELERSYLELQSRMGAQGSEIAEMRRLLEQNLDRPAPQQAPNYDYDSLIDQDPATAAQLAYDNGDGVRLQQAVAAWNEISPGTPTVWAQNMQLQEEMRQQRQQFEERLAPITEQTAQQLADQAYAQFSRTHADVEQYADQMSEVLNASPHLQPLIESNDPQAKVELLDYLYTKAKGQQARGDADNLSSALRTAAQDTARAEEEAAVVSTTRTTEPEQPSEAEQIAQPWLDRQRPFDEGWNIQSG